MMNCILARNESKIFFWWLLVMMLLHDYSFGEKQSKNSSSCPLFPIEYSQRHEDLSALIQSHLESLCRMNQLEIDKKLAENQIVVRIDSHVFKKFHESALFFASKKWWSAFAVKDDRHFTIFTWSSDSLNVSIRYPKDFIRQFSKDKLFKDGEIYRSLIKASAALYAIEKNDADLRDETISLNKRNKDSIYFKTSQSIIAGFCDTTFYKIKNNNFFLVFETELPTESISNILLSEVPVQGADTVFVKITQHLYGDSLNEATVPIYLLHSVFGDDYKSYIGFDNRTGDTLMISQIFVKENDQLHLLAYRIPPHQLFKGKKVVIQADLYANIPYNGATSLDAVNPQSRYKKKIRVRL